MEGHISRAADGRWLIRIPTVPGRWIEFDATLDRHAAELWSDAEKGERILRALHSDAETLSEATQAGAFR